jgi:cell division protein ZapA
MSADKKVVTVSIGGEEYTLRSDRPPEYTRAVAEYVDKKLREVRAVGSIIESHKAAILAALAITDELFQARRDQRDVADRLSSLATDLARLLPPARRGSRSSSSIATPSDGA